MFMNKYVILFLLSVPLCACSQNGFYYMQDNKAIQLHLNDGTYTLDFDLSGGDIVYYERISYGRYTSDSGYMVLHDSILGYTMKMRLESNSKFVFCNGYNGLKGKSFRWTKPTRLVSRVTELDVEKIKIACDEYKNQDSLNPFSYDLYVYSHINHFFDLSFFAEGLYYYSVYDVPILVGSFERIGNLLVLHDNEITEPFYVLIEKEGIIPFLPGIFGLRLLKPYVENGAFWFDNPENYDWYIGR